MNLEEQLKLEVQRNNSERAISIVEELGESKEKSAVPYLCELLESTESHIFRNALALTLADIGDKRALKSLINMLKDPKTLGYRGNLLAALEPFDYSAHMDLLIDYVINGNFEVSRKSYFLIESRLDAVSKKKRKRYKKKLKEAKEHLEGHVKLLSKTIKML